MKRILLIVFITLLWVLNLKSQDTIYTNDGRLLTGEVLEISESTLRLRPDSSRYDSYLIISKYLIDSLVSWNGEVESYTSLDRSIIPEVNKSGDFFVGFDLLSPLNGNARISLEYRITPSGTGIFIPITLNMKKKTNNVIFPPLWFSENSIGLGMKLNIPVERKEINYSFGIALTGGSYFKPYYDFYTYREDSTMHRFLDLGISNGFQVKISRNLYFGTSLDNKLISLYKADVDYESYHSDQHQYFFFPVIHIELIFKL